MAAFQTKSEIMRVADFFVEVGAPREEFEDALGAFFHDDADSFLIAESDADRFGVADVGFNRIQRLQHRSDAALGWSLVLGGGLAAAVGVVLIAVRSRLKTD